MCEGASNLFETLKRKKQNSLKSIKAKGHYGDL